MNILDKPTEFDGAQLSLPLYHRGHLSLFPGAKVWLCLIPGNNTYKQPTELIISPINHDAWGDLWRISLTLNERRGLVHDVFRILSANSFNIITAESATKDGMKLHSIEIVANAKNYTNPLDKSSEIRTSRQWEELEGLRIELLARLFDDIALLPNGEPRLRIRRIRGLLNAKRSYNEAVANYLNSASPAARPGVKTSKVLKLENNNKRKVVLTLPEDMRESIRLALGSSSAGGSKNSYLTISNTSERFIHIYFIKETDAIISPTIEHMDEIGALARITATIQEAGFNILTTLSRLYEWGAKARTEFVLQPPERFIGTADQKKIREHLEQALSSPELVHTYGLSIGYPVNYVTPFKTKKLRARGGAGRTVRKATTVKNDLQKGQLPVSEILDSKRRDLDRQRENRRIDKRWKDFIDAPVDDFLLRYDLLEQLEFDLKTLTDIDGDPRGTRKLFISYSFKDADLINQVKKMAKRQHFDVMIAKKLGKADTTREGILAIMQDCTHFIGIWTEEGGTKVGRGYYPSPWLHWEWGVADALGLKWRLLISNRINQQAWSRIAGSTPHNIFTTATFNDELKDALSLL